MTYPYPGVRKRLHIEVTDETTDPAEPADATLTVEVLDPEGEVTDISADVMNDETGVYHVDIDCPIAGDWAARVEASGAVIAVAEISWHVQASAFAAA